MDLRSVPAVVAWVVAIAGMGLLVAVLYWMRAPAVRSPRRAVPIGIFFVVMLIGAGVRSADRPTLLLSGGGLAVAALPLPFIGRLPADVPSRRYPTIEEHPRYPQLYRRGIIAGLAVVVLEITWIVFWARLVQ
jgi:hypothetical protein